MMAPHSACTLARLGLEATLPQGAVVLAPAHGSPYGKVTAASELPMNRPAVLYSEKRSPSSRFTDFIAGRSFTSGTSNSPYASLTSVAPCAAAVVKLPATVS